jgi:hypothetical protein
VEPGIHAPFNLLQGETGENIEGTEQRKNGKGDECQKNLPTQL